VAQTISTLLDEWTTCSAANETFISVRELSSTVMQCNAHKIHRRVVRKGVRGIDSTRCQESPGANPLRPAALYDPGALPASTIDLCTGNFLRASAGENGPESVFEMADFGLF